jgi:hypothetical protein
MYLIEDGMFADVFCRSVKIVDASSSRQRRDGGRLGVFPFSS